MLLKLWKEIKDYLERWRILIDWTTEGNVREMVTIIKVYCKHVSEIHYLYNLIYANKSKLKYKMRSVLISVFEKGLSIFMFHTYPTVWPWPTFEPLFTYL